MKADEIALRKQAVQLHLSGISKSQIARQLCKSRLWVIRWIGRYQPDDPENSLQDRDCAPQNPHRGWSEDIQQMAIESRKLRVEAQAPGYKYALISATAIHYELHELGIIPTPPVRTIHSWLKQADLIHKGPTEEESEKVERPYPAPACEASNDLHELDIKGPFYLTGSPQKHFLIVLRDVYSKRVALAAIDKRMEAIIDFLLSAWGRMGLPKVLQMDNGLEFRGSNLYPRSPSKLSRVCLDLGVEPLFIPTREPWRNGVVENLNGQLDRLFFEKERFTDRAHLQSCVEELETAINTTHRLPALNGKTPSEFANQADFRNLPKDYNWRKRNLQLVKGKISFIRFVRKSGRITLTVKDKFDVGVEHQWQYVLATVDLEAGRLDIFFKGELIKSFDYC
jgi:putative transposase